MIDIIFFILLLAVVSLVIYKVSQVSGSSWKIPKEDFKESWRFILKEKVLFYNSLDENEKLRFEKDIQSFLLNTRITGIEVDISDIDRILVASSAVIPIFAFPEWRYDNIFEVLLYSEHFNYQFETEGKGRSILGMVGTGFMEGKMALSQKALHLGFDNSSDKKNTAIHEFIHLIDKSDGKMDGVTELLMDKQYILPWLEMIDKKIREIQKGKSDINAYGGSQRIEFLTVISEYFFERPKLLRKKHPELYEMMSQIFNQKMSARKLSKRKYAISRNDDCFCNSGQKFKNCCGKTHY